MKVRKRLYGMLVALLAILLVTSCASKTSNVESLPSGTSSGSNTGSTSNGQAYKIDKQTNTIVPIDPQKHETNVVLLTFDDGPNPEVSTKILNTLDKHKAKAIFFMNGPQIEKNPELVKLVHERGQMIGNHSWDHIDLSAESKDSVVKQMGDVQKAVMDITETAPIFIRPPYLSINENVTQVAEENNLNIMTLTIDSRDWEMSAEKNDPEELAQRIADQLHPGANILMHEFPWTAEALEILLTKATEKGYSFVDPMNIQID